MLTHEDPQMAFDVAREYKLHVDSVKQDRELEEWLEAGFFQLNYSRKMSKTFFNGITPTVCTIMPTAQSMPMEPCQLTPEYAGPKPFGSSCSLCVHMDPQLQNMFWLYLAINTDLDISRSFLMIVIPAFYNPCESLAHWPLFVKLFKFVPRMGWTRRNGVSPRNRNSVVPKSLANLARPRFKVQGVWIHGVMLKLWVVDPRCPADSSTILETLTRTVEEAIALCHAHGAQPPDQFLCWVAGMQCQHVSIRIPITFSCSRSGNSVNNLVQPKQFQHWAAWGWQLSKGKQEQLCAEMDVLHHSHAQDACVSADVFKGWAHTWPAGLFGWNRHVRQPVVKHLGPINWWQDWCHHDVETRWNILNAKIKYTGYWQLPFGILICSAMKMTCASIFDILLAPWKTMFHCWLELTWVDPSK